MSNNNSILDDEIVVIVSDICFNVANEFYNENFDKTTTMEFLSDSMRKKNRE